MPRVTSQKTRQMLLVTGDPLDPSELPEKVQLFNDQGEALMIGVQGVRAELVHSTLSIAASSVEVSGFIVFPSWRLIRLKTNRPARIRLYPSAILRDADLPRGIGVKPKPDAGRLFEIVTYPGALEWDMNPTVDIAARNVNDPLFFVSVTNLDSVTGSVVTTYTYVRTE